MVVVVVGIEADMAVVGVGAAVLMEGDGGLLFIVEEEEGMCLSARDLGAKREGFGDGATVCGGCCC